jgi:hypothetical protein
MAYPKSKAKYYAKSYNKNLLETFSNPVVQEGALSALPGGPLIKSGLKIVSKVAKPLVKAASKKIRNWSDIPANKRALERMKADYIETAPMVNRRNQRDHAANEVFMLKQSALKIKGAATKGYINASLTKGSGLSVAANSGKLTKPPSYRTHVPVKTKQVKPKPSGPYSKK